MYITLKKKIEKEILSSNTCTGRMKGLSTRLLHMEEQILGITN